MYLSTLPQLGRRLDNSAQGLWVRVLGFRVVYALMANVCHMLPYIDELVTSPQNVDALQLLRPGFQTSQHNTAQSTRVVLSGAPFSDLHFPCSPFSFRIPIQGLMLQMESFGWGYDVVSGFI